MLQQFLTKNIWSIVHAFASMILKSNCTSEIIATACHLIQMEKMKSILENWNSFQALQNDVSTAYAFDRWFCAASKRFRWNIREFVFQRMVLSAPAGLEIYQIARSQSGCSHNAMGKIYIGATPLPYYVFTKFNQNIWKRNPNGNINRQ